jgi:hypothetical protein
MVEWDGSAFIHLLNSTIFSRFANISEFSRTVDDCFNIDSKEATRIYKRENIHCLKLPHESWALDERQSITILHATVETKWTTT